MLEGVTGGEVAKIVVIDIIVSNDIFWLSVDHMLPIHKLGRDK